MSTTITLTHLVVETQSPMAINSGGRELGFDTQLARDVNGLPMLPASAIAGVWRHLCQRLLGEAMAQKWFGTTEQAARFVIGHGQLLDKRSQAVAAYVDEAVIQADPILSFCAQTQPHYRDRVALNDRGVAKNTAKFDQILLPTGLRFALLLQWHTQPRGDGQIQTDAEWEQLLGLWQSPQFALGSSTRNGLGQLKVVHSQQRQFDLSQGPEVGQQLQQFRQQVGTRQHDLQELLRAAAPQPFARLSLQALDNWRCGRGSERLGAVDANAHKVDLLSYSEPRFEWLAGHAQALKQQAVLCGSSIKGALAHRIAFHYRRHTHQWADDMGAWTHQDWQARPEALRALLGHADEHEHHASQAGVLWVQDAPLRFEHTLVRHHNSIDRFSGGVRHGALYSEELLYQPSFELQLFLSVAPETLAPEVLAALNDTIADLRLGRLPLGAGSGRGNSLLMPISGLEEITPC